MVNARRHDPGVRETLGFLHRQSQGSGYRQIDELLKRTIEIKVKPKIVEQRAVQLLQARLGGGEQ